MSYAITAEKIFGWTVTTFRESTNLNFQYECGLSAISILFFRQTIRAHEKEPYVLRLGLAACLATLAYLKKPYEIICALEIFSFVLPRLLLMKRQERRSKQYFVLRFLVLMAIGALVSLCVSHVVLSDGFLSLLGRIIPSFIQKTFFYFFPVLEMYQAYDVIALFVPFPLLLQKQLTFLLFVTFHIQVGMGYLGIDFLKKEQQRRNTLVRLDMVSNDDVEKEEDDSGSAKSKGQAPAPSTNGVAEQKATVADDKTSNRKKKQEAARRFQRGAPTFILATAVPYMLQIILFGNMNFFAYHCVLHDIHRQVRLHELFKTDSRLVQMAHVSATSPDQYAASMDVVVSTVYDIFNRKLFSFPKLLLLPSIIMRQPLLVIQITPLIFGSDFLKARIMAFLTQNIERLKKESIELTAIRTKVEAFDMKNAELLQRSGPNSTAFTKQRWQDLTKRIQQQSFMSLLLNRTKRFFNFIQHHFVFSVMIDCALATLLAMDKIVAAEIFVFSRAMEDAVDTVLMRSRAESELARMLTETEKLQELATLWGNDNSTNSTEAEVPTEPTASRRFVPCQVDNSAEGVTLQHLYYSRGTAVVKVERLVIAPGVYALTGANGSGKSTMFRVLMSCSTNSKPIDLPESILLNKSPTCLLPGTESPNALAIDGSAEEGEEPVCVVDPSNSPSDAHIIMPSTSVVEISQNFYWPLYTRPVDWIYQRHLSDDDDDVAGKSERVAILLQELEFRQEAPETNETESSSVTNHTATLDFIINELQENKEDWFNDLSGGQKSKVELVRNVLLQQECPGVLLIDETMAPLDPSSKAKVMSKLKVFCGEHSVVVVIYHTDVKNGAVECVPSNDFFDANLHLENQTLNFRPVC